MRTSASFRTNVSHALRLPPKHVDGRPVVSIDLRDLAAVLSIDEENGVAHVQVRKERWEGVGRGCWD